MTTFALVDCNNFYVSCERAFNPRLENKPVIVLSNNDGCVISRSNEAKIIGIKMGEPFFKCERLCQQHHVNVFSSNFELYGDVSCRIMTSLRELCPEIEIYSIDEAFLSFDTFANFDLTKYSTTIRETIKSMTGIPISIGFATTKTLAKIANHIAKKQTVTGVFGLTNEEITHTILKNFPVREIWGVGKKLAGRFTKFHIHNALDLKNADPKIMRREFSVVMEKMIAELNGESCLPLDDMQSPKKQIMSSRSFGAPVTSLQDLEEAVSTYVAIACVKLREQHSAARGVYLFLYTNRHRQDQKQYANTSNHYFITPTDNTGTIITQAKLLLKKIYRPGYQYKKAGILLLDLIPNTTQQFDLLAAKSSSNSDALMQTLTTINNKFGKKSLFYCAEGITKPWQGKRHHISKRCTTRWDELITASCK